MGLIRNNMVRFKGTYLFFLVFLSACSHTTNIQNNGSSLNTNSNYSGNLKTSDPLEKYNRRFFVFNVGLDNYIFKPAAKVYKKITPDIVDTSISNFFQNLDDVGNAINNVLQFKIDDAINDTERFVFNSTFGIAGLLDVASAAGLQKHDEDFGQTLAHWGVSSGPYLMLPFLGPSTVRDTSAKLSIDGLTDPTNYSNKSFHFSVVDKLNKRADLLSQEDAFKDLSDDPYSALRDIWIQRRDYLIRDGKSDPNSHSDLIDELESLELE